MPRYILALSHTRAADRDARLATSMHDAGLTYQAPNEYTRHSTNESRRAELNGFLKRSRSGQASLSDALMSPDPVTAALAEYHDPGRAVIGRVTPTGAPHWQAAALVEDSVTRSRRPADRQQAVGDAPAAGDGDGGRPPFRPFQCR